MSVCLLPSLSKMQSTCPILLYIVICGLSSSTIFFPTLSHKRHDFRGKKVLNIKVFWFSPQLLSEAFFVLRRIQLSTIKCVYWSYHYSCQIWIKRKNRFSKNTSSFFFFNRHCNPCGFWPSQLSLSILSRKVFIECRCQRHVKPPTWRTSD